MSSLPIRAMIVEDDEDVRNLLELILSNMNVEVEISATTGEAALSAFKQNPVEFVLLDMYLPGTGGYDLLRAILRLKPECHVVMLSNEDSPVAAESCLAGGAKDYICKALGVEEFRVRLIPILEEIRKSGGKVPSPATTFVF